MTKTSCLTVPKYVDQIIKRPLRSPLHRATAENLWEAGYHRGLRSDVVLSRKRVPQVSVFHLLPVPKESGPVGRLRPPRSNGDRRNAAPRVAEGITRQKSGPGRLAPI